MSAVDRMGLYTYGRKYITSMPITINKQLKFHILVFALPFDGHGQDVDTIQELYDDVRSLTTEGVATTPVNTATNDNKSYDREEKVATKGKRQVIFRLFIAV